MKHYYYVYKVGGAAPRLRHELLTDAQGEAERLARLEPGHCFEILMCLGHSQSATVQTFWNDDLDPDSLP